MSYEPPRVGHVVRAIRDIMLARNAHVTVLSSAAPTMLRKGSQAEIVEISSQYIDVNCNDGSGWGLMLRVAKVVWGTSFQ